jgi:hypothetical protein
MNESEKVAFDLAGVAGSARRTKQNKVKVGGCCALAPDTQSLWVRAEKEEKNGTKSGFDARQKSPSAKSSPQNRKVEV